MFHQVQAGPFCPFDFITFSSIFFTLFLIFRFISPYQWTRTASIGSKYHWAWWHLPSHSTSDMLCSCIWQHIQGSIICCDWWAITGFTCLSIYILNTFSNKYLRQANTHHHIYCYYLTYLYRQVHWYTWEYLQNSWVCIWVYCLLWQSQGFWYRYSIVFSITLLFTDFYIYVT